jgi:hypothetical protein
VTGVKLNTESKPIRNPNDLVFPDIIYVICNLPHVRAGGGKDLQLSDMLVIKYCLKFMSRNCRHCTPVGKAAA